MKDLIEELSDLEGSIAERAAAMRTDVIAFATFVLGLAIGEFEFFGNSWAWLSQNLEALRHLLTSRPR